MELTIYALIYWNDNFKSEVKKMLNKKVFSTMFLLSTLLVGCFKSGRRAKGTK